MAFRIDQQTINDLRIFAGNKGNDIYSFFNKTKTRGGAKILKDMFLYPRSTEKEINDRVEIIQFFFKQKIKFLFENKVFDAIEEYLSEADERTKLYAHDYDLKRKCTISMGADTQFNEVHKGVLNTIEFLIELNNFQKKLRIEEFPIKFQEMIKNVNCIFDNLKIVELLNNPLPKSLNYRTTSEYDELFRFRIKEDLFKLLYFAYNIDVYITIANVAEERNFCFAEIVNEKRNVIEMYQVYHPLLPKPIANDIIVGEENNMIFLTGANMAGKSTFMKTFGIALYLAHMGFPVPAQKMKFSLQTGMYTTINLSDNLNMGYSHFYAEVKRVKKVAQSVNESEGLIIIFDELFRGTNVKDAYEGTVAIANAFAKNKKCVFIISTHIIEAGHDLQKLKNNIKFLYLPTIMKDKVPEYTYKIAEGITNDRHGMVIINNEKILDILKTNI